jgi:hypothetical protein
MGEPLGPSLLKFNRDMCNHPSSPKLVRRLTFWWRLKLLLERTKLGHLRREQASRVHPPTLKKQATEQVQLPQSTVLRFPVATI